MKKLSEQKSKKLFNKLRKLFQTNECSSNEWPHSALIAVFTSVNPIEITKDKKPSTYIVELMVDGNSLYTRTEYYLYKQVRLCRLPFFGLMFFIKRKKPITLIAKAKVESGSIFSQSEYKYSASIYI